MALFRNFMKNLIPSKTEVDIAAELNDIEDS